MRTLSGIRILLAFLTVYSLPFYAQHTKPEIFTGCAASAAMNLNESLFRAQVKLDEESFHYFSAKITSKTTATVELIPTVVHIIHNGGPENISNAQVQAAITNINSKFITNNNYQIQLCLAQRDPTNNPTTGITRDSSALTTETLENDDIALKNINRWSPTCYLNIWVVSAINSSSMGSGVVGYAYFPAAHGQPMDGIVIEAGYFGTSPSNDNVGAHELGHYLGLYHTFENACTNNNCLLDGDQVCDTPPDQTTFSSCVPSANSCNTDANDPSINNPFTNDVADLSNDYMDYSALTCYTQFTAGQYDRMQFFLTGTRSSLLGCLSCVSPCPAPLTATITSPSAAVSINTGNSVNFSGTLANTSSCEWYMVNGTTLSTNLSTSYTFTTAGTFWMKFKAISSNTSLCLDDIDSVMITVIQPPVSSCFGAIQLTGTNDAVLLPTPSGGQYYHNANGFTWECWVNLTAPFSSYSGSLLRPIIVAVDPVGCEDICLSFGWQGGSGNVQNTHLAFKVDGPNNCNGANPVSCDYFPTGGFSLNTWYHVAGTMDYVNNVAKLYCNGVLVDTKTNNYAPMTRAIPTQLSWDIILNSGYPNPPLGGYMDEVRIWSRVRTPAEIAANYNQCLLGNEQDLMVYYRCNQSAGSFAIDATTNGYNGNLTNTSAWSPLQAPLVGSNCSIGCVSACPSISAGKDTIICPSLSVQLNATPGFTSYTWTPVAGLNNPNIANPTATPAATTTYVVTGTATDTAMQTCTSSDTVILTVTNHVIPTLNLGNDIFLCSTGAQVLTATPGFLSYQWQNGSALQTFTAWQPGKYWVTATDSCGGKQSDTVLISLASLPPLSLLSDTTICVGDSVQLLFSPPGSFTSYQWYPVSGLTCVHCPNPFAAPAGLTQYFLLATTGQGCTVMDSVLINVTFDLPTQILSTILNATCSQNNGTIQIDSVVGGAPPYQFSFNGSIFSGNILFQNLPSGIYQVRVRDSAGCNFRSDILLIDHPGPSSIQLLTSDVKCDTMGQVRIVNVSQGTPPYVFALNAGSFSSNTIYTNLAAGTYSLVVKDSNSCLNNVLFTINEVPEEELVVVPNCFSPNNDSINERWFISGMCVRDLACIIYNRWGNELMVLHDLKDTWDGTFKGHLLSDGVYYYVLNITFQSGKTKRSAGSIQLLR